ncbi:uncharacterized protein LOC126425019 isoform X2 [Schistocerca serialis cubense]|uniref:uncharacterized protein LOC126425019 isoform X2 n=1 Tax=Schistocerca serialis cubense TaxID=2023355 RepID=UPI00214F5B69|nr:uncharacterized protein LOC126425019 isoform X2 [Schistocerca serialis cubense]
MEFAGEDIEIKEEPISTDPYQPPEIEQIYIKEENVKLETPEDNDAHDPLKLEEDEFVSEEETGSPPDAIHIKKEPGKQQKAEPIHISLSELPEKKKQEHSVSASFGMMNTCTSAVPQIRRDHLNEHEAVGINVAKKLKQMDPTQLRPWKNLRDAYMKHKMLAKDTTDLSKNMYKL